MTKQDYISYVALKLNTYSQSKLWFATGILAACIDRFCTDAASEDDIDLQANKCAEIVAMCKNAPSPDSIIMAHDIIKRNINVGYVRYKAPHGSQVDGFFDAFLTLFLMEVEGLKKDNV